MARPLRIEYDGAWYHVMNRGAGRQTVFKDSACYYLFLDLLSEVHKRYHIQIHAFCLMSNHYHLLIHTPHANLGKVMRHIDGLYTVRSNRLLGSDGPLFRGRYKAIIIEAEKYLIYLSRYIHLNPVEANVVQNLEDYQWSSYKYFSSDGSKPLWLYTDETLKYFNFNRLDYMKFLFEGGEEKSETIFDKHEKIPIMGSEEFVKKINEEKFFSSCCREVTEYSNLARKFLPSMDDVISSVVDYFNVSLESILNVKHRSGNLQRNIAIYLSRQITAQNQKIIAEKFGGITYSAVSKICAGIEITIKKDENLLKQINQLRNILSNFKT